MTCIHDVPLDETCRDCMIGEPAGAGAPVETLRDRFAMAALTGLVAHRDLADGLDVICYGIADAMLAERAKGK